jgi:hypothetical protein
MSATIVGSTVRRPAGPWTPAVHALLRHFEAVAFAGAPRAIEVRDGVEVVSYVDGERSYDDADGVVSAAPASYWVPLRPDDDAARHGLPTDRRGERLRLLLDGYGLTDREGFVVVSERVLQGGDVNLVVRVGDTVRRPTGPWSPAVHALLRHVESVGFDGAPRFLDVDERGREVLSYVDGDAASRRLRAATTPLISSAVSSATCTTRKRASSIRAAGSRRERRT